MPKLNDTQLILLSTAAQRLDRNLLPLPDTLAASTSVTKAINALVGKSLVEEGETDNAAAVHRVDGDIRYGVFATLAGLAAIGIGDSETASTDNTPAPAKPERQTKSATLATLLQREQGATLDELVAATGWLPHTARAALTGLRKKGHTIDKAKRDDATCYSIKAKAA